MKSPSIFPSATLLLGGALLLGYGARPGEIASASAVAQAAPQNAQIAAPNGSDLFAVPPQTDFYFPPYAMVQPQWKDGQLALDLKAAKGKELAVLNFTVPTELKPGARYTLRFVAQSSQVAPLIVTLPQAKEGAKPDADGKSERAAIWAQHDANGQLNAGDTMREISFSYAPDKVKDGDKIQFFWDKDALADPSRWTFSQMSLVPAGTEAPAQAPVGTMAPDMGASTGDGSGLFPAQFWYPPYAEAQPQWKKGAIVVGLDDPKSKGKNMAALTLKLPADLRTDADYRIRFNATASAGGAMIIQVPEPDARGEKEGDKFVARGDWQMHAPDAPKKRSVVFVNRPQLTAGGAQITLFWGEDAINAGGTWTLSNFEFTPMN